MREGLLNEDELKEIENGFSVSDSATNSALSGAASSIQSSNLSVNSPRRGGDHHSRLLIHPSSKLHHKSSAPGGVGASGSFDMDARIRFEQQRSALQSDVAHAK